MNGDNPNPKKPTNLSERKELKEEEIRRVQLSGTPVGRFILHTGDIKYNFIETREDIERRLPGVINSVATVLFDEIETIRFIGGVNVDFDTPVQVHTSEALYGYDQEALAAEDVVQKGYDDVSLFDRVIGENNEKGLFKVTSKQARNNLNATLKEAILPQTLIFDREPKLHVIPTLNGALEFRGITPETSDELDESTKILLYVAMGVAEALIFYANEEIGVSVQKSINLTQTEKFLKLPDMIGRDGEWPRLNIQNFDEEKINLIRRYQLLLGVATQAVARNDKEHELLLEALTGKFHNELEEYIRDDKFIAKLQMMAQIAISKHSASQRGVDTSAMAEGLSELWIAAGHPLGEKDLKVIMHGTRNYLANRDGHSPNGSLHSIN